MLVIGEMLVVGDCIKGMRELEAGSVDLVFADPPFNTGFEYDLYRDTLNKDAYLDLKQA